MSVIVSSAPAASSSDSSNMPSTVSSAPTASFAKAAQKTLAVDKTWGRVIRPPSISGYTNTSAVQKKGLQVVIKKPETLQLVCPEEASGKFSADIAVAQFVQKVHGVAPHSAEAALFKESLMVVYGDMWKNAAHADARGLNHTTVSKIFILEEAHMKLMQECVIEVSRLTDEGDDGVMRFFRPGRTFKVKDVHFFNKVMRGLITTHPHWARTVTPKSTKPVSEVYDILGMGPHALSARWTGHGGAFRGPKESDPQPGHNRSGVRDGLYFNYYEFSEERLEKATKLLCHYKGFCGQKPEPGVRARKETEKSATASAARILCGGR
jgi:hypothetical protein